MRKIAIFDFLGKKVDTARMMPVSQKLIETLAYKELALYIAISYIANTLSKCEIKVFEKNKEVQNKLYYKLNISPNPNESSSQFMNKLIEAYYYDGHALIVPQPSNDIYIADNFVLIDDYPLNEYIFKDITFGKSRMKQMRKASDVFYFKLDNKKAKSLIDSVYNSYGKIISQAIESYCKSNGSKYLFKSRRYKSGDDKFNEDYNEKIQKQLQSYINAYTSVLPQYEGEELKELSTKNPLNTTDVISVRKEIFEVTAQAFKIPNSMMLGNITNMNEIVKNYLSLCIDPIADMMSEEFTRKYYSYDEWTHGYFIKIDTSCIKHVDILEVADKIFNAVGSGAFCIDDIRKRCGLIPLGTEFSTQHFVSKNFEKAENALNEPAKGGE